MNVVLHMIERLVSQHQIAWPPIRSKYTDVVSCSWPALAFHRNQTTLAPSGHSHALKVAPAAPQPQEGCTDDTAEILLTFAPRVWLALLQLLSAGGAQRCLVSPSPAFLYLAQPLPPMSHSQHSSSLMQRLLLRD